MQSFAEHAFNFNENANTIDTEASATVKRQHPEGFL